MSSSAKSINRERLPKRHKTGGVTSFLKLSVITALALVTVGCGGSSGSSNNVSGGTAGVNTVTADSGSTSGQTSENTTGTGGTTGESFPAFQGSVSVSERQLADVRSMTMSAGFFESGTRVIQSHQFFLGQDSCQENLNSTGFAPENINAGDVLVISNADGTLMQLDGGAGDIKNYTQQLSPVTAQQSSGMTLDIPGDQYPQMPTLPIQDLDSLSGIQPEIGSTVTAQTVFQWVPSIHPDTIIELYFNAFVNSFNVSVGCTLVDDGEFFIPAEFQAQLGETSTINWSMSRSRHVDHFENDAYLKISRTISADVE